MRILFANCGYATGLSGRYSEYFLLFWRYARTTNKSLTPIIDCVLYEKPDVAAFVELNYSQYTYLKKVLHQHYPYSCEQDKYGKSLWRKFLPVQNVHLVFSKLPLEQSAGVLFEHGTKKGILKAKIGGIINLVLVHLSLRKKIRSEQIVELRDILMQHASTICLGDFNTFGGSREIDKILEKDKMLSLNRKHLATYPSYHPLMELDYALVSNDLHHRAFKVMPETFSDHRAIMLEITAEPKSAKG